MLHRMPRKPISRLAINAQSTQLFLYGPLAATCNASLRSGWISARSYQIASTRPRPFIWHHRQKWTFGSDPNLSLSWQIEKQIGLSFLIVVERRVEFLGRGLELADTGKCYV
jgi:hypothetical protein